MSTSLSWSPMGRHSLPGQSRVYQALCRAFGEFGSGNPLMLGPEHQEKLLGMEATWDGKEEDNPYKILGDAIAEHGNVCVMVN